MNEMKKYPFHACDIILFNRRTDCITVNKLINYIREKVNMIYTNYFIIYELDVYK